MPTISHKSAAARPGKPTPPRPALVDRVTKRDSRMVNPDFTHADPLATLMLLQMLADTYEDRRVVLEIKQKNFIDSGAAPAIPKHLELNDNQKRIEEFLMRTGFLSRPASTEHAPAPETTATPLVIEIKKSPKAVVPLSPTKRLLAWSKSTSRKLPKKALVPKIVLRLLQKHIAPAKKCQPQPKFNLPKATPVPTPVYRPARPALPRIVPSVKPRRVLRRMSSADSRALLASSVRLRQKRIHLPVLPAFQPVVESYERKNELQVSVRTKLSSSTAFVAVFVPDEDDVDLPEMPETPTPGQIINFYLMNVVFFFVDFFLDLLFDVSACVLRVVGKMLCLLLCIVFYFPEDD